MTCFIWVAVFIKACSIVFIFSGNSVGRVPGYRLSDLGFESQPSQQLESCYLCMNIYKICLCLPMFQLLYLEVSNEVGNLFLSLQEFYDLTFISSN